MRLFRAYSTMVRLAFANPAWAISAALAKAFTPTGLKVLLAYLGAVIIGGFWLSLKARELGFEPRGSVGISAILPAKRFLA